MSEAEVKTARDVLDALHGRWPDDRYLFVEEAPQDAMRMGRKIDALVISCWQSRGYELDAVEVKVSMSDWKRELEHPEKADWWWQHSHRYWIATPSALAVKIKDQIPETWGLLGVSSAAKSGTKVLVQAPKHKAQPLPWPSMIGVLRATANAGLNALSRAEQRGYSRGHEVGVLEGSGGKAEQRAQQQLDQLRAKVKVFEAASGIELSRAWNEQEAAGMGEAVNLLLRYQNDADLAARTLGNVVGNLKRMIAEIEGIRDGVQMPLEQSAAS